MTGTVIKADGTLPNLQVLIDVTTSPTSGSRTWTDITTDVRALSYTRGGRNDELQRTSAGTLQMTLDNRTARYDPTNGSGIGIKRAQWVQIRATWAGVTYNRWTGIIQTIDQSWPADGKDAISHVTANDVMRVLNLYDLTGQSFSAQLISDRVAAVVALTGTSSNIYDASTTMIDSEQPVATAGEYLATLESEENGRIFADENGALAFQSRYYSIRKEQIAATSNVIGDNLTSEIPYREVNVETDDGNIYNRVTVTGSDGIAQTANDATSQTNYFLRKTTRSIKGASNAALSLAQFLVFKYKDPPSRVSAVTLIPQIRTATWPTVLSAYNGVKFTVKRRAPSHTISADYWVEQITETVVPGQTWSVAFMLQPVDTLTLWVLDSATYSVLDSTATLAY